VDDGKSEEDSRLNPGGTKRGSETREKEGKYVEAG